MTRCCKCDDCQRSYGKRGGPHEGHDAVCETCEGHPGHVPCPDCEMTSADTDPEIVSANAADMLRALEAAADILRRLLAADRAGDPARLVDVMRDARDVLRMVDDTIDAVDVES